MQYFKIAVLAVAALVCTSTAGRVHMIDNDVVKNSFEVNKHGRGALVVQAKARAATAEQNTVTVTITTIPDYCNTATPMIPLVFPTTTAQNSTITTSIKTVVTTTSQTGTETTSSATGTTSSATGTISSATETTETTETTATTSSGSTEVASAASPTTPSGTLAGPTQETSALPTSNDADGKRFNGALVVALLALTGNVSS